LTCGFVLSGVFRGRLFVVAGRGEAARIHDEVVERVRYLGVEAVEEVAVAIERHRDR
jgi:hypothetical protein